jgi:hypothetical protein
MHTSTRHLLRATLALAFGAAGLTTAVPAFAASTNTTIQVRAIVIGTCRFVTGSQNPSPMLIGNSGSGASSVIDPSIATNASGNATVSYQCTTGTAPTFSLAASIITLTGPSASMPALITANPPNPTTGTGFASTLLVNLNGQIQSSAFRNVPAGQYDGTATLVMTF